MTLMLWLRADICLDESLEPLEYRIVRPDGEIRWVRELITGTRSGGESLFSSGTLQDITEVKLADERSKKSEARYRHLVEHSQACICTHDLSGRLLSVNPAVCKALGYSADEMIGASVERFLASKVRSELPGYLQRLAKNQRDEGFLWLITKDRRPVVWGYYNTVYHPREGEPYVLGHGHDVSELMGVQHRLRTTLEEMDRVSRAKSDFLARMSHELRTLMNAILGFAQLLDAERLLPLDDKQREYVEYILTAGRHLLELIDDVLDLARVESGRLAIFTEAVKLAPLIEECIADLGTKMASNPVSMQYSESFEADYVYADRTRLKQVILNLLSNAIKYNREKGSG